MENEAQGLQRGARSVEEAVDHEAHPTFSELGCEEREREEEEESARRWIRSADRIK